MNLFGDSDYLEKLSLKGDPLERLEKVVDFECFRPTLNRIFKYDLKNKSHGGRPPYDLVLMLKILILQRLYNDSTSTSADVEVEKGIVPSGSADPNGGGEE